MKIGPALINVLGKIIGTVSQSTNPQDTNDLNEAFETLRKIAGGLKTAIDKDGDGIDLADVVRPIVTAAVSEALEEIEARILAAVDKKLKVTAKKPAAKKK